MNVHFADVRALAQIEGRATGLSLGHTHYSMANRRSRRPQCGAARNDALARAEQRLTYPLIVLSAYADVLGGNEHVAHAAVQTELL